MIQRITYIRKGECEPEKCGNACCKALTSKIDKEKFKSKDGVCKYLKDGKCSKYDDRPDECKDFPNDPNNPVYKKVEGVCTYWFDRIVEYVEEEK